MKVTLKDKKLASEKIYKQSYFYTNSYNKIRDAFPSIRDKKLALTHKRLTI